jgi:hypothetical protein
MALGCKSFELFALYQLRGSHRNMCFQFISVLDRYAGF